MFLDVAQLSVSYPERPRPSVDRVTLALEVGGDEHAMQLGRDLGEIVWQAGSIATGVGGAAKAGVPLETIWAAIKSSAGNSWVAEHDVLELAPRYLRPSTGRPPPRPDAVEPHGDDSQVPMGGAEQRLVQTDSE